MSRLPPYSLPWLEPGDAFPPVANAWPSESDAPGLLAAGGALTVDTLKSAYSQGIFPWYSEGQPVLWWSTDPRMVLRPAEFRLTDSLRKQIRALLRTGRLEVRMDHGFATVMACCSTSPRAGQSGTWITPAMRQAYAQLHEAGYAHSVETWIDGELAGGLYLVNLGRMVFGESMFTRVSNASKIALAALVAYCRVHGMPLIDCQQQTAHLHSLGARPVSRADFCQEVAELTATPQVFMWQFNTAYWEALWS